MRGDLPSGTVTFLFTDVEGSTKLLHELGAEGYADALAEHRRLIREACAAQGGVEVDTQGDAFFFAFPSAVGALAAAAEMTEALASGPIRVRIGLHTGTPLLTGEGYVGDDVHLAARVASAGHGGQILVSSATGAQLEPSGSEPQALSLLDLGEHRLKDISDPVPIFQLGDDSFPPLKTISNTNLPRPASSFVGREAELQEVLARIETGARLLTLTGPGGSGKTRLALEAATSLVSSYKAGVFWVGLASLRDPALVVETVAQTLGAKDGLPEHIGERELLLLLDNLEQVIAAAPELSALLSGCPNLTMLVTSRELLRVQGEVEYPVPPLAQQEAVALFCERAQLEPTDEIAELCARLDSLPLAVELAAARAKALSPAQILERLSRRLDLLKGGRDADPRQQTLRATIEWSYELLSPEEQTLFRRLSVFAGGCTLEAAEEVAEADLDTLQSLVEKNLLRYSGERYWMLETIREFAVEGRVGTHAKDRLGDRHARFFRALLEQARDDHRAGREESAGRRVSGEFPNIREALTWTAEAAQPEIFVGITVAASTFWLIQGHYREAESWLTRALAILPETDEAERARILGRLGEISDALGDLDAAISHGEEAVRIWRRLGREREVGEESVSFGLAVANAGDLVRAESIFLEALNIARRGKDPRTELIAMGNLADLYLRAGDPSRAAELFAEVVSLAERREYNQQRASALSNLGLALTAEGEMARARGPLLESLRLLNRQWWPEGIAYTLVGLAAVAASDDDEAQALTLLGAAWALAESIELHFQESEHLLRDRTLDQLRTHFGDEFDDAWASARAVDPSVVVAALIES
jgi:predicted ATPase/class 3 adenylate cyclase